MVVYWTYLLGDGVGALPVGEDLAAGTREKQEHVVPWLELPWLGRAVVSMLLFLLGHLHVFHHDGDTHPIHSCMTCTSSMTEWKGDGCSSQASLATSRSPPRSPPKEELERSETGGGLGSLPNREEHVWEQQVPVLAFLIYDLPEHLLEILVKLLYEPIHLGVVDGSPEMFHLQEPT